jgi:hypothetical protein
VRRLLTATETVAAVFLLLIALLTAANVDRCATCCRCQIPDWFDGTKMLHGHRAVLGHRAWPPTTRATSAVDIVWEHLKTPGRRVLDIVATTADTGLPGARWPGWSSPRCWPAARRATTDLRHAADVVHRRGRLSARCAAAVLALARVDASCVRGHDPHADLEDADGP